MLGWKDKAEKSESENPMKVSSINFNRACHIYSFGANTEYLIWKASFEVRRNMVKK